MDATNVIISQSAGSNGDGIDAICLGSGRFLRSVLVPFLSSNSNPAVFQTRGRTFIDSLKESDGCNNNDDVVPSLCYPVDTIQFNGSTTTSSIEIYAAGTLGTPDGKSQLMDGLISKMNNISVIGVGVTEAGLQSADNQCMLDLTHLLNKIFVCCDTTLRCANPNGRICVINTDNVPNNGCVIRSHVLKNAGNYGDEKGGKDFVDFLLNKVSFLNSMVDRITSSRPNSNGLVPLCEPLPNKALVICDQGRDLPVWMGHEDIQSRFGVKIRHDPNDLESDIALKLRVANGTHTAVAHVMALLSLVNTEALCNSSSTSEIILNYLDSLYQTQILPAAVNDGISAHETNATWDDWRKRLRHPHFGLSTFFITQNGAAKCGIRLGPTIKSLVNGSVCDAAIDHQPLSVSMAFAVAAILRFLTPIFSSKRSEFEGIDDDAEQRGVYVGWLDDDCKSSEANDDEPPDDSYADTVTYADGLRYNRSEGWYEFRCDCPVIWKTPTSNSSFPQGIEHEIALPDVLSKFDGPRQPCTYREVVRSYLLHSQGGNLQKLLEGISKQEELSRAKEFDSFVSAVSTLYSRMVSGDCIVILLQEMMEKQLVYIDGFASSCSCLDGIF